MLHGHILIFSNVNSVCICKQSAFLSRRQHIVQAGARYLASTLGVVPLHGFKTMLSALEN